MAWSENTLIVFASDNGAQPKLWSTASEDVLKWDGSDNVPMRGEKGSLWEGGIRVPMFAYWPGVIPAGQTINDPVISLDFVATTHKLINGVIPEEFDGVDLMPRLTAAVENIERRNPLFWDYENELATREGDWKLRRSASGDYLFNLKEDPYELQNLAYRETEKRDYLIEKLNEYEASLPESGRADITPTSIGDNVYVKGARFLDRYVDDRYILPETDTPSIYPAPIAQDKLTLEAENYDEGQNVGFYDSTAGNFFGDFRDDDVDIKTTSVTYVSNITSGEWLKFTVNQDFNVTPTYTIQASIASPRDGAGEIEIYFDDNYVATVPVTNTGGINKFKLSELAGMTLPTHVQEVKLSFKAFVGKYSFDKLEFIPEEVEE